jgi:hypothetical protein
MAICGFCGWVVLPDQCQNIETKCGARFRCGPCAPVRLCMGRGAAKCAGVWSGCGPGRARSTSPVQVLQAEAKTGTRMRRGEGWVYWDPEQPPRGPHGPPKGPPSMTTNMAIPPTFAFGLWGQTQISLRIAIFVARNSHNLAQIGCGRSVFHQHLAIPTYGYHNSMW